MYANALDKLGTLYRNNEGNEVWRIVDLEGVIQYDNIASDYDAAYLADTIVGVFS